MYEYKWIYVYIYKLYISAYISSDNCVSNVNKSTKSF